jgi:hypothetical protein
VVTEPNQTVNVNDLLIVIGQQTVELVLCRARITELEAKLAGVPANGVAEPATSAT